MCSIQYLSFGFLHKKTANHTASCIKQKFANNMTLI